MKNHDRKKLTGLAYTAAQWTWGLPQTLIGAALFLAHRKDGHFDYNGASATVWDKDAGISLGKFIFVPRKRGASGYTQPAKASSAAKAGKIRQTADPEDLADRFLLEHEYGHTLQSLLLGPFYLLLIGAPSMLWSRLPYFARKRKRSGKSYYSAPFEKSANYLASKASKRSSDRIR